MSLKRLSSTVLKVSWDASITPGVAGYQVFYSMLATPDMDKWQTLDAGPHTTIELKDLQPLSAYAVRIRTKLKDGRISDFSKVIIDNFVLHGLLFFSIKLSQYIVHWIMYV